MKVTDDLQSSRLTYLREALATFPASVAEVSYALSGPPPLIRLSELVSAEALGQGRIADPVLARFIQRLRKARPELTLEELLQLAVPMSAGDQEVYTARLGKWLFEKRMLERAQRGTEHRRR